MKRFNFFIWPSVPKIDLRVLDKRNIRCNYCLPSRLSHSYSGFQRIDGFAVYGFFDKYVKSLVARAGRGKKTRRERSVSWQQPRRARSAAGPMKNSPLSTHILPVDNLVVMEVRLEAAQAHRRVDVKEARAWGG